MASNNKTPTAPKVAPGEISEGKISRKNQLRKNAVQEIIFWEDGNPKCVVNMVSDRLRELMRQLPPSLLSQDEKEMRRKVQPGWTVEQLRLSFWDEYFAAVDHDDHKMQMSSVFGRICGKEHFYELVKDPLILGFIACPPSDYVYKMRTLLDMGLERFQQILKMDLMLPNGVPNTKLISEITKIVALIDNRVKGAVVQKIAIDQTSKNLNVNVNQYEPPKSSEQIEDELAQIEREMKTLTAKEALPLLVQKIEEAEVVETTSTRT